jgi:hypothetical protein
MNPITQPLRKLVEKWKKMADAIDDGTHLSSCSLLAGNYLNRADDIESLIPQIERDIEGAPITQLQRKQMAESLNNMGRQDILAYIEKLERDIEAAQALALREAAELCAEYAKQNRLMASGKYVTPEQDAVLSAAGDEAESLKSAILALIGSKQVSLEEHDAELRREITQELAEVLASRNQEIATLRQKAELLRPIRELVAEIEMHCPCGARPESLNTHPHVAGCPVLELARLVVRK